MRYDLSHALCLNHPKWCSPFVFDPSAAWVGPIRSHIAPEKKCWEHYGQLYYSNGILAGGFNPI